MDEHVLQENHQVKEANYQDLNVEMADLISPQLDHSDNECSNVDLIVIGSWLS